MKLLILIVASIAMFLASASQAQVSVNVNIGSPPMWGPVGYTEVRYYYLPDVYAYYDIHTSMFIYYSGGAWIHRAYLPTRYRSYDLYGGYKVVMTDYRGDSPYDNFKSYKVKYAKGYKGSAQKTIGVKPGKGNNKARKYSGSNSDNKKASPGKSKNNSPEHNKGETHNNERKIKNDKGHSGGKGKKK